MVEDLYHGEESLSKLKEVQMKRTQKIKTGPKDRVRKSKKTKLPMGTLQGRRRRESEHIKQM